MESGNPIQSQFQEHAGESYPTSCAYEEQNATYERNETKPPFFLGLFPLFFLVSNFDFFVEFFRSLPALDPAELSKVRFSAHPPAPSVPRYEIPSVTASWPIFPRSAFYFLLSLLVPPLGIGKHCGVFLLLHIPVRFAYRLPRPKNAWGCFRFGKLKSGKNGCISIKSNEE
jgi:hypothetical protein